MVLVHAIECYTTIQPRRPWRLVDALKFWVHRIGISDKWPEISMTCEVLISVSNMYHITYYTISLYISKAVTKQVKVGTRNNDTFAGQPAAAVPSLPRIMVSLERDQNP